MRGALLIAALLALATTLPAVDAGLKAPGVAPIRGIFLVPQLYCEILYDTPGTQRCDVYGPVQKVNEIRLRMVGQGHVFAFADDISGPYPRQLGVIDCTDDCSAIFPRTTSTHVALYIYTEGGPETSMTISVQSGTGTNML